MARSTPEEKLVAGLLTLAFLLVWQVTKLVFRLFILPFKLIGWVIGGIVNLIIGFHNQQVSYSPDENPTGWVYVLSNPSLPEMVKVGMTTRSDCSTRVAELSRATSIPTKFKIEYQHPSPDPYQLEQRLHQYFKDQRVNSNREFFSVTAVDVKKAIAKLEPKQKRKYSNQILDPTWTTPVLKAESDSQAGHE